MPNPTLGAPTILEEIVRARRTHLPAIRELMDSAPTPAPSTRSLKEQLLKPGPQFIMECKSASPSQGVLRADYRPRDLARIYSQYAAGISVLCEPERFGGSYEHLATVAASTHLPVLCKDFIVDPAQVLAARHFGADAILLMLSVLSDAEYADLSALAASLGLDVLTEVISTEEVARAARLGAQIVGINNRNLHDLSIDLDRTRELAPLLTDRVVVSESGIRTHGDVTALAPLVDAFLVGTHLSGSADVDAAARELVFGANKVCGLTRGVDAQVARASGAVYGGLIFADSPRAVTPQAAREIMAAEPGLRYVAVTRGEVPPIDAFAIQLHAPFSESLEEDLALISEVREAAPLAQVWRALDMRRPEAPERAQALVEHVDRLVLDSGSGGTGVSFDWARVPDVVKQKSLLAGGLGPDNAAAALAVGCAGLDLNSGVERAPGVKDAAALAQTFATIRHFPHPLDGVTN